MSDLFDLSGKTAVVTGASVGIGRMIAHGLAAHGANVGVVSRTKADCDLVVADIVEQGGQAFAVAADLSDPDDITRLAASVRELQSEVHILVNNAGRMIENTIEDFTVEQWDSVMNLDLRAPFFVVQAFLPMLRAAGSMDDPVRIINIGSVDGIKPPFLSTFPYPAAKAALHHLTRQLAGVLAPDGITVNAIAPGAFPSRTAAPILEEHLQDFIDVTPLARIGRPDDIAGTAVYLASRAGSFTTGAIVVVDGGLVA